LVYGLSFFHFNFFVPLFLTFVSLSKVKLIKNNLDWSCGELKLGESWAWGGQGELTPSLPHGKNPEIGNLSIFRILTSNLVSKVFY
jgi:hypothetical protein